MSEYQSSTYGDRIAGTYDRLYPSHDPDAIEFLAALAGDGRALELGIGTGRIALPLRGRGVSVQGLDASTAMVARLREKPGGEDIAVTIGDFAAFSLTDRFRLIYVPFNTIFALRSQEQQIDCFACVARHLEPGGVFVVEAFVPDPSRFELGQRLAVSSIQSAGVSIEAARYDPVTQRIDSQLIEITEGQTRFYPVQLRCAYPSELDLMARLAGLRLRERWASWGRQPFVATSGFHVSVYARP
jgi:SAM-dependent methyltransferase